ncbi:MAG: GTPase, partial [Nocardioidaceae bacterium]|nr:GTPase [Nocardioidaceae bacterium]
MTVDTSGYAEDLPESGSLDSSKIELGADYFDETAGPDDDRATDWGADGEDRFGVGGYELEERHALRRVSGLSTELDDVSEVEYRRLRLERVVLVGVWTEGTAADA